MLPYERKKVLENYIDEKGETNIDELLDIMPNVSSSTIRRDLKILESEGIISIYYGGIIKKNQFLTEQKIESKRQINIDRKIAIARYAATFVNPDETIFLDSGSTVAEMIPFMDKSVHIVTTSLDVVNKNINELDIYLLGGQVSKIRNSVYGITTVDQMSDFVFDKAFLGANGISEKYGITTPSVEEAMLKRKVITNTKHSYFLIDSSKIGSFSTCKICNIEDYNVLMDEANHLTNLYKNITFPNKD